MLENKHNIIVSDYLAKYLYGLKIHKRNDVYETLILMLLNDNFHTSLNLLIEIALKNVQQKDGKITFEFFTTDDYVDAINNVCESAFFIENYSAYEIRKKKTIANNLVSEVITGIILSKLSGEIEVHAGVGSVSYPRIYHRITKEDDCSKITMTFDSEAPLNELIKYLKEVLFLSNKPRKKILSLGKSYRLLGVYNDVCKNPDLYANSPYAYIEELVAREFKKRYKEEISIDSINKSLQRIKKIKSEINKKVDISL